MKCGSVRAVRLCVSVERFAVFAVHRGGRFLAFRFRLAVRFAAFLKYKCWRQAEMANEHPFETSQQSVTGPAHPESRSIGATTHYINARAWSIDPKVAPSLGSNYF